MHLSNKKNELILVYSLSLFDKSEIPIWKQHISKICVLSEKVKILKRFCFNLINVFAEVFLATFQPPRKTKAVFHGHLTRFKIEKLIHVKEESMFIFQKEVFLKKIISAIAKTFIGKYKQSTLYIGLYTMLWCHIFYVITLKNHHLCNFFGEFWPK